MKCKLVEVPHTEFKKIREEIYKFIYGCLQS
jgi:hypothetical protein